MYINFLYILENRNLQGKNQSVIVLDTLQVPHILTLVDYTSHEDRLKTKFSVVKYNYS